MGDVFCAFPGCAGAALIFFFFLHWILIIDFLISSLYQKSNHFRLRTIGFFCLFVFSTLHRDWNIIFQQINVRCLNFQIFWADTVSLFLYIYCLDYHTCSLILFSLSSFKSLLKCHGIGMAFPNLPIETHHSILIYYPLSTLPCYFLILQLSSPDIHA